MFKKGTNNKLFKSSIFCLLTVFLLFFSSLSCALDLNGEEGVCLDRSKEKYDKFTPESEIYPDWGKEDNEQMIIKCTEQP